MRYPLILLFVEESEFSVIIFILPASAVKTNIIPVTSCVKRQALYSTYFPVMAVPVNLINMHCSYDLDPFFLKT